MAEFSENFGLEFLTEDDTVMGFLGFLAQEGKPFIGYYGYPYIYKSLGDVEYWLKTEKKNDDTFDVIGVDTHCSGNCVWNMVCTGIDLTPKDSPKLTKLLMLSKADGSGGMVPVELIAADVLPGFAEGDKITAQVIALPIEINYYADEDAYAAAQPDDENGEKWLIGNGALLPLSFLINHNPETYDEETDFSSDAVVHFTATVTKLYNGIFDMAGDSYNNFIKCFADTEYGPLEFEHTLEQVPEEQRQNIKVGSVISGICILSGDVAIDEYNNGAIKDFEHDLILLRYTFTGGDPDRLRSVLAENAVYSTETSGKDFCGADSIIEKIKYVQSNNDNKYYAYFAVLTDDTENDTEYPAGTRCIVLASGQEDNYESVAFIEVNNDGMIERIKISTDSRYHFKIDDTV